MNVIAIIEIKIPTMMFVVIGSPKTNAPTSIAVIGSNTPRTDAFVAPIFLVAIANVAVETIVGSMASPMRLSHAILFTKPLVISTSDIISFIKNTTEPTLNVYKVKRLLDMFLMVLLLFIMTINIA